VHEEMVEVLKDHGQTSQKFVAVNQVLDSQQKEVEHDVKILET
jgi:hypothetical protein